MAQKNNAKLTPEVSEKICEALEKGHSIKGACGHVGIHETTYYNWYNRGKEAKSGKYKQFVCDVDNARAKATCKVEKVILDIIPESPQDAKWWLTKHAPDTYVDRQETRTQIEGKVETEVTVNLLERVKAKRRELNDSNSSN